MPKKSLNFDKLIEKYGPKLIVHELGPKKRLRMVKYRSEMGPNGICMVPVVRKTCKKSDANEGKKKADTVEAKASEVGDACISAGSVGPSTSEDNPLSSLQSEVIGDACISAGSVGPSTSEDNPLSSLQSSVIISDLFCSADEEKSRKAYEEWQNSKERAWQELLSNLPQVAYEFYHFSNVCSMEGCGWLPEIHCMTCYPRVSFCSQHAEEDHSSKILCRLVRSENLGLVEHSLQTGPCYGSCGEEHDFRNLQIVLPEGELKQIRVCTKGASSDMQRVLFYVGLGLWPSTPTRPVLAYSVRYLETVYYLSIEGGLSVQKITSSFCYRNGQTDRELSKIYAGITNGSFTFYKDHRLQLDPVYHLGCLACPSEVRNLFVPESARCETFKFGNEMCRVDDEPEDKNFFMCMDAMFSCGRLDFVGQTSSQIPSKEESWIFEPKEVGLAIKRDCESQTKVEQECSDFNAIAMVQNKNSICKYEITGIFEASCEHHCTIRSVDMYGGEGYGFARHLISKLTDGISSDIHVYVSYDIGCMVKKFLERNTNVLDRRVTVYVPTFHAYGHTKDCQREYSARVTAGAGLVDGEGQERIWAYKKSLSSTVKVMTEAGRRNVLTHAGLHTRTRSLQSLGAVLLRRYEKASRLLPVVSTDLSTLLSLHPGITDDLVDQWEEQDKLSRSKKIKDSRYSRDFLSYFSKLEEFHNLLVGCNFNVEGLPYTKNLAQRLEKEIREMERKLGINSRPDPSDIEFQTKIQRVLVAKRQQIRATLHSHAVDYRQIDSLRGKLESGQSVKKRFDSVMKGLAKKMKDCVDAYNALPDRFGSEYLPSRVTFDFVKDVSGNFYAGPPEADVPLQYRRQVVETRHLLRRHEEELRHLKQCVLRVMKNMQRIRENLTAQIGPASSGKVFYMMISLQRLSKQFREYECFASRMLGPVDSCQEIDSLLSASFVVAEEVELSG